MRLNASYFGKSQTIGKLPHVKTNGDISGLEKLLRPLSQGLTAGLASALYASAPMKLKSGMTY
jgi:hypothetical protein